MVRRLLAPAAAVLLAGRPAAAQAPLGPNLIDPYAWFNNGSSAQPCGPGGFGEDGSRLCLRAEPGFGYIDEDNVLHVAPGAPAVITQTVPTLAGSLYRLGFLVFGEPNRVGSAINDVIWNGVTVTGTGTYTDVPGPAGGPQRATFQFRAVGPASTLQFTSVLAGECVGPLCDDFGYLTEISEIELRQARVTATPEPATLALVGGGLLALGALVRRRARSG